MGEKRKLLAALDAHRGRNVKLERQKKLQKQAEKKKKLKHQQRITNDVDASGAEDGGVEIAGVEEEVAVNNDGWETEESEKAPPAAVCG